MTQINPNSPTDPRLGGDAERSVTYETKLCKTAKEIDDYINKDKYAFSYIYWNTQAEGVFITLCKPNPKSFIKYSGRIEQGLEQLTESQARELIMDKAKEFYIHEPNHEERAVMSTVISIMYDSGLRIFKPANKEAKP